MYLNLGALCVEGARGVISVQDGPTRTPASTSRYMRATNSSEKDSFPFYFALIETLVVVPGRPEHLLAVGFHSSSISDSRHNER